MKELVLWLCLAAGASAVPWYGLPYSYPGLYLGHPYFHLGYHYGPPGLLHQPWGYPVARLVYHGAYTGNCEDSPDGLYYVDDRTFAYCSHGKKTLQACAEGSANPPRDYFHDGSYYTPYEFCSVNLLAKTYMPGQYVPDKVKDEGYEDKASDEAGYQGTEKVSGYTEEVHSIPAYDKRAVYAYKLKEVHEYNKKTREH